MGEASRSRKGSRCTYARNRLGPQSLAGHTKDSEGLGRGVRCHWDCCVEVSSGEPTHGQEARVGGAFWGPSEAEGPGRVMAAVPQGLYHDLGLGDAPLGLLCGTLGPLIA